jgi:hypothetical protein
MNGLKTTNPRQESVAEIKAGEAVTGGWSLFFCESDVRLPFRRK